MFDGMYDGHAGGAGTNPGSHSAASVQRVGACGGGAGVHARSTDCGLSVAARHAGRNSGARVSRTRRQPLATLFTACYMLTHALIVLIGLSAMAMGECPARRKSADGADLFAGACVDGVLLSIGALGTDFLFLSAPPIGTPLVWIGSAGYGAYIACLQGIITLLCLAMDGAGRQLFGGKYRPADFFAIQKSKSAV